MSAETTLNALRIEILRNPSISVDELKAALERQGRHPSRLLVSNQRRDFLRTLRLLRKEGLLNKDAVAAYVSPTAKADRKLKPAPEPRRFYYQ